MTTNAEIKLHQMPTLNSKHKNIKCIKAWFSITYLLDELTDSANKLPNKIVDKFFLIKVYL